jgi:hypothetical protein
MRKRTGKGTSFLIYFPVIQKSMDINRAVEAEPIQMGTNENILFVEDDETTREAVGSC